jgi:hypothetical protein
MSDKPKPGKDKDLRYLRQATEETDRLFGVFCGLADLQPGELWAATLTEAMLLVLDQLDLLDQMIVSTTDSPVPVIELNRKLRKLIGCCTTQTLTAAQQTALLQSVQALGGQLRALLVVKEIRLPL